ncbi:MAG: methyltransferase domain-containing protein [Chloroflexota bacterium]
MSTEVFDRIAGSWYNFFHYTRFKTELEALARRWQKGKLLNLGCGHGADFLPFVSGAFCLTGVDYSLEMLRLARKYARKFHFRLNPVLADVSELPFADETFDFAIAVATYHHLKGKEQRERAVSGLYRILKPGGEAFITVWNHNQPRFFLRGKEVNVPWRTKDEVLYRYYYLFSYPELGKLVKESGFSIIGSFPEKAYFFPVKYFSRNICLLVKKETGHREPA